MLHLKTSYKLGILIIWNMLTVVQLVEEFIKILLCGELSVFDKPLKKRFFIIRFCIDHTAIRSSQRAVFATFRFDASIGGSTRIHSKLWTSRVSAASASENIYKLMFRISDQPTQTADLIRYQGIHRIHNDCPDTTHTPTVRRISCFGSKLC